jgi:hypothetical protein
VDKSAWDTAFDAAFKTAQANYQAARMAGGGDGIVPFAQGLVASPFQIALNAAKLATGQGGSPSVGAAGMTSYERDMAVQNAQMRQSYGFATGGMIHPGDSQQVQLFKSPDEVVAIFTPQQVSALRGDNQNGQGSARAGDGRPISISMPITIQSGAQVSRDSVNEMRRQMAAGIRDALRSVNGR